MPKTKGKAEEVACIHQLTLKGKLAERIAGHTTTFSFKPGVNIIAGPNGCGKSTIMGCLYPTMKSRDEAKFFEVKTDPGPCRHMDFEKNNPRVQSHFNDSQSMGFQIGVRFSSHGEMVKAMTSNLDKQKDLKGAVMLMDEPEVALDIDGVDELRRSLEHCYYHKNLHPINQYIIATHAPALVLSPYFNVIELVPGYRRQMARSLETIVTRMRSADQGSP